MRSTGQTIKDCARGIVLLKLTNATDRHEAWRGLSARAEFGDYKYYAVVKYNVFTVPRIVP